MHTLTLINAVLDLQSQLQTPRIIGLRDIMPQNRIRRTRLRSIIVNFPNISRRDALCDPTTISTDLADLNIEIMLHEYRVRTIQSITVFDIFDRSRHSRVISCVFRTAQVPTIQTRKHSIQLRYRKP